jgi:hypothetical protein
MDKKPVCAFCTRMRIIIICPLIAAFVAFRPEFDFIKNYDLMSMFAWFITFSIVVIFSWKAYKEHRKKK